MKYLFFLIILLIPIGLAQAEQGKNFDTENLGNGLIKWTSHYDRVFDGINWQNYILENDAEKIQFKSERVSFLFDKSNCVFELFDPINNNLVINSYQFGLAVDGISTSSASCIFSNFTQSNNMISFKITQDGFSTLYELKPYAGLEWTHEIINNEGKSAIFTITETCKECTPVSIDGNLINFGVYTLDTKNDIHNTVKETKSEKGDYIIEYEKVLSTKEQFLIDPVFSSSSASVDVYITDTDNTGVCATAGAKTDSTNLLSRMYGAASPNDCETTGIQWNTSSVPDAAVITSGSVFFKFDISSVSSPRNCDYMPMTVNLSTATDQQILDDTLNGTPYLSNDVTCTAAGDNKSVNLGSSAEVDIKNGFASDRFVLGIKPNSITQDATDHFVTFESTESGPATPKPTLEFSYSLNNAVTDLTAIDIRYTSVDISWSAPSVITGSIQGYQINKTTPWNSVVFTVVKNNTNSGTTSYTVPSLTGSTQYSFRVGVWNTLGGINASGNVLNVTTDLDPTASFTPGTFNLTASGTDVRTIKYERVDINPYSLRLNVTYPNAYNTTCNFYYKFALVNNTYTNLSDTPINSAEDEASFLFNNVTNEIINVACGNGNSTDTAKYVITQTNFPILDQIANFRNGTYGTMGNFGALDFVSIIVILVSMVGFNRVNETVGIVMGLFIVGGLAVISAGQIISWAPTMTAAFAVLIMWAISTTRKD